MKKIRRSVFETNSSSTHSISIASGAETLDTLAISDGKVRIHGGEFGWEVDDHYDVATKASYCMVWAVQYGKDKHKEMLKKVVAKHMKVQPEDVIFEKDEDDYCPHGYIDHQSDDVCEEAFKNQTTLKNFIFNPASWFHTCNDNGSCGRCEEEWERNYRNS